MAKRLTIIQGHPDSAASHLCHGLADAYAEGAKSTGAEVDRIEVSQLTFPLLKSADEFSHGIEGTPAELVPAQKAVQASDHITIIYPLWLGTMPAVLKGFLEQVLRPGVALGYSDGGYPKPLLKGKSARVIVTMAMPAPAYRWYFGAHSLKSLERSILGFCGVKPIRSSLFGGVESASPETRAQWLEKVRAQGRLDAS